MKVYLINYDLNKSGQDYTDLINEIKKSTGWIKYLKSGWFIATNESVEQVYTRLRKWMDNNDEILINQFTSPYYGWLSKTVWEWLKNYGF
jgi:hypothetical protein